jgi:glycerol-3-phosphate dehydrogenase (NAD+)
LHHGLVCVQAAADSCHRLLADPCLLLLLVQVAEGVATAGVVIGLARKYRVSMPVLTAVAQVLDNNLTPKEAVYAIMNLPQIDEH